MNQALETLFTVLNDAPRLLIQADLRPVQGERFQPTGFPDLGAATYKLADGTQMLLVESAQSMANRLEEVCWNKAENKIVEELAGLPHLVVDVAGSQTSTIQEAHRLNSPYLMSFNEDFKTIIKKAVGDPDKGSLDIRKLAQVVFQHDVGSVLHGVFLEKVAGRLRLQRLLSGFIEARGVLPVTSGGVKLDHVNPTGNAKDGYGNVPFTRTEYTAAAITAYFNLDLATMRGYGLGEAANRLLIALSLYKMHSFLQSGLRLRTACDLDVTDLRVTRPENVTLAGISLADLKQSLPELINACAFAASSFQPVSITEEQLNKTRKKKDEAAETQPSTDE
jgi:CRISPR-associated protein Csb1